MLIVATIAATGAIVRLWPVARPVPLLASRHIHLYQTPLALQPVSFVRGVRLQADRVRPASAFAAAQLRRDKKAGHYVQDDVHDVQPDIVPANVTDVPKDTPQEVASDVAAHSGAVDVPVTESEPVAAVDVVASAEAPVVEVSEAAPPVASSSRGIVELPAVAVTRAVTIAGRGIMTGLRATGAILRAPF